MTKTIKVKVGDLAGVALDWAVAKCEGVSVKIQSVADITARRLRSLSADVVETMRPPVPYCSMPGDRKAEYSSSWELAGPIIKRENISLSPPTSVIHVNGGNNPGWRPSGYWKACTWHPGVSGKRAFAWHETEPLIAAMRCYVRSKLGDEIEVPAELAKGGQ